MSRFKFIVDCLPYAGAPDGARQQGVTRFIAKELQLSPQDVRFTEVAIGDAAQANGLVQPGLVVYMSINPHDENKHREIVVRIAEAVQALALYVVRISVQQIVSYAAHLLTAGALSGTALGGSLDDGTDGGGDSRAAGMFLGAVLGALIGGTIGSAIAKDGPVLGIWQRDEKGIWRWTPARLLVPLRRQPA